MQHEENRNLSIGEALDMGVQLAMVGQQRQAETLFRGVLKLEPKNFEATERLGVVLFEQRKYHEALYWFWRGRKLDRRQPMALTNYGLCVSQLGHPEEGLPELEKAVYHAERSHVISPEVKALAQNNLGNTLLRLDRHAEALAALDRGIKHQPNHAFPHYNRGIALLRMNRHRDGIAALDRSIELDARSHDARYNRGLGHLLLGDLKQGFEGYEFRLMTSESEVTNLGLDPALKWLGENLTGKRILVHCEQGLGDEIQFMRFVPILQSCRPAEVLMVCHAATRPIAALIPGVTVLEPDTELKDRFDCWVAEMSLPLFLGLDEERRIPEPYLPPMLDDDRLDKWQRDFPGHVAPRVGICWAGNFLHKNDAHRSIPLKTFARLFDADASFISLQQMRPEETEEFAALKNRHPNLSALWLDDLRDTAAVMVNLDLVISVDTAVAHLAATLGIPTWILLPKYGTDWRWQLERLDSPWYPGARLIRQDKIGDWDSVIASMRKELSAPVAGTLAA